MKKYKKPDLYLNKKEGYYTVDIPKVMKDFTPVYITNEKNGGGEFIYGDERYKPNHPFKPKKARKLNNKRIFGK